MNLSTKLEQLCQQRGLRLNKTRRVIIDVLDRSHDHPSAEDIHKRIHALGHNVSLPTVYRTLGALADLGVLAKHEFGDGKARFEEACEGHHEHLIDVKNGGVVEFREPVIERLVQDAAARLGYRLIDYRLELFAEALT